MIKIGGNDALYKNEMKIENYIMVWKAFTFIRKVIDDYAVIIPFN